MGLEAVFSFSLSLPGPSRPVGQVSDRTSFPATSARRDQSECEKIRFPLLSKWRRPSGW